MVRQEHWKAKGLEEGYALICLQADTGPNSALVGPPSGIGVDGFIFGMTVSRIYSTSEPLHDLLRAWSAGLPCGVDWRFLQRPACR